MAKTESHPRRRPAYKTAQFWLAGVGSWFVISGFVGGLTTGPAQTAPAPTVAPSRLKVVPARQQPGNVVDELQGAGGLQNQTGSNLQQPSTSDQLQPNAKTDTFTPTSQQSID